ncbi:FAD-dependent oxidoreductase [Candidatus Woesearchaeota archaeon]|nr:FAD-dependent oxidoreductase [Candidatus Woesearchaeota archaeon]
MIQENIHSKILEIKEIAEFTKAFVLEKPKNFDYLPGQHVFIEIAPENGKPFSLVSSPTENFLEFATIIRNDSPFKQELNALHPGDKLIVSGPYSKKFYYEDEEKDIAFIAGGIGITPFIGILRYLTFKNMNTRVTLLYSNKTFKNTAFRKELDSLVEKNNNIRIVSTMTEDPAYKGNKGRIDKKFIQDHIENIQDKTWYIAGAPKMVEIMYKILKEFNVKTIKLDSFTGY